MGEKILFDNNFQNDYQIVVFINAPENSPYKNEIFNFVLKFQNDYPTKGPKLIFKTRILHVEALYREDNWYYEICIYNFKSWYKKYIFQDIHEGKLNESNSHWICIFLGMDKKIEIIINNENNMNIKNITELLSGYLNGRLERNALIIGN